jgi:hypothetical protein
MSERRQCAHQKSNGIRCRAFAQADDRFCFFHSPDLVAAVRRPRRLAARPAENKTWQRWQWRFLTCPFANSADICVLLSTTISEVCIGKVQPRVATAVGYLANILLGARQHFTRRRKVPRIRLQRIRCASRLQVAPAKTCWTLPTDSGKTCCTHCRTCWTLQQNLPSPSLHIVDAPEDAIQGRIP